MGYDERSQSSQGSSSKNYEEPYGYSKSGKKDSENYPLGREEAMSSQKRGAIRPKESMKEIMYGGGIGSENENPQKVSFRVQII